MHWPRPASRPTSCAGLQSASLVGAAYAAGKPCRFAPMGGEGHVARDRRTHGHPPVRAAALSTAKRWSHGLRALGVEGPIESYAKRYAAIATDLASGREVWLERGAVLDAVRASIAIPGIFSPTKIEGKWLVDGGLSNPVPVSVCRALGAEVIIAVNLNGDLLGRRFAGEPPADTSLPSQVPNEFLAGVLKQLPASLRGQATQIIQRLLPQRAATPGYFEVLANSINIMQDYVTRARLAGEPPHVMLAPRLRDIGLMEFNRAQEAIAEGRYCVEQAMPTLQHYCG